MHLHDILDLELTELQQRLGGSTKSISIIETGTIRGMSEPSRVGDGWSTLFFAKFAKKSGGRVVSIDLNTKTAERVLRDEGLIEYVLLNEQHSVKSLAEHAACLSKFDVAFLDSDNDPQLIFHEFLIAELLVCKGGLIMVDDVRLTHHTSGDSALAKKGDLLLPYLNRNSYSVRTYERQGWADYKTGVIAIDQNQ